MQNNGFYFFNRCFIMFFFKFTAIKYELIRMMKKSIVILIFLVIITSGIHAQITGLDIKVEKREMLKDVVSATGFLELNGEYFVVGDDSPWLYKLSKKFKIKKKYLIFPSGRKFDVIPEAMKPDFEAVAHYHKGELEYLLIFGSGLKSPQRDVLVKFKYGKETEAELFSMKDFYAAMRKVAGLQNDELNIAGAVISGNILFLLEHNNNLIFVFKMKEIEKYFENFKDCPLPDMFKMKLPETEGVNVGFSGATATADGNKILFTASLNGDNVHHANGSFVGLFNVLNLKNELEPLCVPVKNDGKLIEINAESVVVTKQHKNTLNLTIIGSNDSGLPEVLQLEAGFLFKK